MFKRIGGALATAAAVAPVVSAVVASVPAPDNNSPP